MPVYSFEALSADGETRKGVIEADSAKAARSLLRKLCLSCQGAGCSACGQTGSSGRSGVFELLVAEDAIRAQIHSRAAEADIRAAALASGMTLMRDDGERLVQGGITSREELIRVTRD